jgi:histidinol-phosphate aminotransferase
VSDAIEWSQRLIRADVRDMAAYHVPDHVGYIKLDAMENPYSMPSSLTSEWLKTLQSVDLNRYPHPSAPVLRDTLRRLMALRDSLDIMFGNGSDELIQIMAMAVATPGAKLLSVEPAFVMYRMIARFVGLEYVGVPLDKDFGLDRLATLQAIAEHQPAIIFLAQPNNPTGNVFDPAVVKEIIELAEGLVVIDEAYLAFTDADALPLLDRYPNVVVMRTLSKVGLAGLRLGFLIGHPAWINEFDKLRLPYNINVLTQVSATFALEHYDVLREQTRLIRESRETLVAALQEMPLDRVWPSEANFVLVRTQAGMARPVFEAMKARKVLIKCLHGSHPSLQDCLRLTVGSPEENRQMLSALADGLSGGCV